MRYGPHTTCVNRFNQRRKAGHWARIPGAISEAYDGDIQMIDSSSIRAQPHAANGEKRRPIRLKLTAGQAHDGRSAADMPDPVQDGRILPGDRAHDSDALRATLKARGAGCKGWQSFTGQIDHPLRP